MSIEKVSKNPILKTFLIKAGILYLLWMIINYAYIKPDGRLNNILTNHVIHGTTLGLQLLGFETKGKENIISINDVPVVLVKDQCNGLELIALYVGFILCFPGKWKYKLIYIAVGSVFINLINIMREIVLALNYKMFRASFEFNHKYTYVLIVYIVIFLLWKHWVSNYSIVGSKVRGNA